MKRRQKQMHPPFSVLFLTPGRGRSQWNRGSWFNLRPTMKWSLNNRNVVWTAGQVESWWGGSPVPVKQQWGPLTAAPRRLSVQGQGKPRGAFSQSCNSASAAAGIIRLSVMLSKHGHGIETANGWGCCSFIAHCCLLAILPLSCPPGHRGCLPGARWEGTNTFSQQQLMTAL